jgi:hypothetical protein
VPWNLADWTWSQCQFVGEIISEIRPGVPGEHALPPWLQEQYKPYDPYEKQKREKFIRLLCKVKGEPEYDEKKKVRDDIKITVDDVALVIKAVSGIDIKAITEE